MNKTTKEIAISFAVLIISFSFFSHFDFLEKLVQWSSRHERYEIDEILSTFIVLVFLLLVFAIRRWNETARRTKELQDALHEIKVLKGTIPICSYCKQIRDEEGVWNDLEAYIRSHSDAEFSHGVCPECYKKEVEKLGSFEKYMETAYSPGGTESPTTSNIK